VLGLYGGGVALRVVAQPLAALVPAAAPLLPLSGLLELAGGSLAVGLLVATFRRGPALDEQAALRSVLPYLLLAFGSLWLSLALNLVGLVGAADSPLALVTAPWQPLVLHLALLGFLVPICVAMSVRTFPLYLRVRVPAAGALRAVWLALVLALGLRLIAVVAAAPTLEGLGRLLTAGALLGAAWMLDAPLMRSRAATLAATAARARARGVTPRAVGPRPSDQQAGEALLRSAYAWLVVAALLLLAAGVGALAELPQPPLDAERHALGAGFITLLIYGMGVYLLPGFLGRHLASARLAWATFWLGNAAALLRVGPLLLPWLADASGGAVAAALDPLLAVQRPLLTLSGVLGTAAIACFGWNLWRTLR
jgi:uncharacterized protein involved in response to NO